MRDSNNIRQVEKLGVDMIGFIFWPHSSRYVGERPDYLPTECKRVGVFVDATTDDILQHIADYRLDVIQLHGHETPEYVRSLKNQLSTINNQLSVIKAFNIAMAEDFEQTNPYEDLVDYFLFDTKGPMVGGNGQKFDWGVLDDYTGSTPFLLSGGIGPDDAERLSLLVAQPSSLHPLCFGIDLNSRFETLPGMKDVQSLRNFLKKLRHNE